MNALEFYRIRNDLTQEELGKKIGVTKQTIYKWEKKIAPISSKHYQSLKDILHLSESDLLIVIKGGDITGNGAGGMDADSLARQYRILRQRLTQTVADNDRQIIIDELARLDRLSRHISSPASSAVTYAAPGTIRNTPELRECIKDAMLKEGLRDASDLNRWIGYDSPHTMDRLLDGRLNWFPDVLSAVLDGLKIKHADAPMASDERDLLMPDGVYTDRGTGVLTRPIPIVDWANAATHIASLVGRDGEPVMQKWDPETTDVALAPVGVRRNTLAFRVRGVSMEPTVRDGDILFCEEQYDLSAVPSGRIVVVCFSDSSAYAWTVMCKRLRRAGKVLMLTSDNEGTGKNITVGSPEEIAWLGVVVRKSSEM